MSYELRHYSGMLFSLLLVFILLLCCSSTGYANYVLDTDFGNGGIVSTDFGLGADSAHSLVLDDQDRLVVAGSCNNGTDDDFALARYASDGELDTDFGTGGITSTDFGSDSDRAWSLEIDSQGWLVVAGYTNNGTDDDFALARYTSDGELDTDFGTDGITSTDFGSGDDRAYSLAIDSQGRLVLAGYTNNGTDDDFALARYKENGDLDETFGENGIITTDFGAGNNYAYTFQIDSQDRLVVAGSCNNGTDADFALARYVESGDLDPSFGIDGITSTDFGSSHDQVFSVAIMPVNGEGRIVVAGESENGSDYDFALARYTSDGALDQSFGRNGKITTYFGAGFDRGYSLLIDSDGRIVVVGHSNNGTDADFALARYKENGDLDEIFGENGIITTDFGAGNNYAYTFQIDSQDRLVLAGSCNNGTDADFALARYKDSVEPVEPVEPDEESSGGYCNISSFSALSILLVVPLMYLSKRGK